MLRRCASVFVELSVEQEVNLRNVLCGGNGIQKCTRWRAYAPHLDEAIEISTDELLALKQVSPDEFRPHDELKSEYGDAIERLLAKGLILEAENGNSAQLRDQSFRDVAWWPLAALTATHGRWHNIRLDELRSTGQNVKYSDLLSNFGPAPTHDHRRGTGRPLIQLAGQARSELDKLLASRKTCRHFDPAATVSVEILSTMMARVWSVIGTHRVSDGLTLLKKTSPAGGGLHATEAYLLVQRAEGLGPGLYHYVSLSHALEPIRDLTSREAQKMATCFLAGQRWFESASIIVIMTTRFDRLFWKYRRHSKAWRVASLDAGHLSQTLYLSAADLGLGAFVSAVMDDRAIEDALMLDPMREGVTVVAGFGRRLSECGEYEPEFSELPSKSI